MQTDTYDVRVRIEEVADLYVGEAAREAIQADANRQCDQRLVEANRLWADLDVTDIDAVKAFAYELARANDAANALIALAPIPDDPEEA